MSAACPLGQGSDKVRTPFGQCMDAVRTLDPTRPDPEPYRPEEGSGLFSFQPQNRFSPDPVTSTAQREVWHHLTAGLRMLSPNDHGHDWPLPRRQRLAELLAQHDHDLCIRAARETREIVVAQDRAPNITALYAKKLGELADVRGQVRESLETAA